MSLSAPGPTEIRVLRQSLGLSQAKLAERIGSSTRAVEEWEAGRRAAPAMLRLALAAIKADLEPARALSPVEGPTVCKD
jgi:DNA-binding transcriptional regulator YiaG